MGIYMPDNNLYKFDKIGFWSEMKLDIIEKYGKAYTNALKNKNFTTYYIDGFSGGGTHLTKNNLREIPGSSLRALEIEPAFNEYHFIDLDSKKIKALEKKVVDSGRRAFVHEGDCNLILKKIFPEIQYKNYKRAFCLLDPYGLHLDWEIIKIAGNLKTIDLIINFPTMSMNRAAFWKNYQNLPPEMLEPMNKFWGNESWKDAAYKDEPNLFGTQKIKKSNNEIAFAFQKRLKDVAKFKFVSEPLPMNNSNGSTLYYLFFASQQALANRICSEIFDKYRKK